MPGLKIIIGQQIQLKWDHYLLTRGVKYLLCVTVIFKYAWVKPLKDKKAKTVLNGFLGIVNECKDKPNKLWVDEGNKFYNSFLQTWLHDINIVLYSTNNGGKSEVAERFIRTLRGKIFKK